MEWFACAKELNDISAQKKRWLWENTECSFRFLRIQKLCIVWNSVTEIKRREDYFTQCKIKPQHLLAVYYREAKGILWLKKKLHEFVESGVISDLCKQDGLGEASVTRTPACWKLERCNTENFFHTDPVRTLSAQEGPSIIPWWLERC